MKGIIDKTFCLHNIYEDATDEEKQIIRNILAMWEINKNATELQIKKAEEIIKKYRPEYFE